MYNDAKKGQQKHVAPPRFAIGGARATIDPRNAKVEELLPLAKHKLELPHGWEKVHQYIYVLQPTTDEHGWQYRSAWSDGPVKEGEEVWTRTNGPNLDVRRRLWMTTVVKRSELLVAKAKLTDTLTSKKRGSIMEGELYRQESGTLMKSWTKRYVVLNDNSLSIWTEAKEKGGKKLSELSMVGCEAKMLFGVQCPGREYAFSVRHTNGSLLGLFDSATREVRRRWVVAIRYQLALLSPDVNFPPFDYGPPTGEEATTRVLMCGELQKQGHVIRNWKNRFFQLTPSEIQYYDRESLKGALPIIGASLITDETSLDFTLRSKDNKILTMRADTLNNKATWVRALSRQIVLQNEKEVRDKEDAAALSAAASAATMPALEEVANEEKEVESQQPIEVETPSKSEEVTEPTTTETAIVEAATVEATTAKAPTAEAATTEASPAYRDTIPPSEDTALDSSDVDVSIDEDDKQSAEEPKVVAAVETALDTVIMTTEEAAAANDLSDCEEVDSEDGDTPSAADTVDETLKNGDDGDDVLTVAGLAMEDPKDANDQQETTVEATTVGTTDDDADKALAEVIRKSDEEIIQRMSATALAGRSSISENASTPSTPAANAVPAESASASGAVDYSAMIDSSGEKPIKFASLKPVGSTPVKSSPRRESFSGAKRRPSFNASSTSTSTSTSEPAAPDAKAKAYGGYQKVRHQPRPFNDFLSSHRILFHVFIIIS
jgi:hypothetical protein